MAFISEAVDFSFGAATNGSADVRPGVGRTAAGQDKGFQRRDIFGDAIYFCLQFSYFTRGDAAMYLVSFGGQVAADVEKAGLGTEEKFAVVAVVNAGEENGDESIQFVDCAVGLNATMCFLYFFSSDQ